MVFIHLSSHYTSSNAYYVYQKQINGIIGDQEWLNGDMNCLLNLAANRRLSLSMGAQKRVIQIENRYQLLVMA
jgi:hypothetical protein